MNQIMHPFTLEVTKRLSKTQRTKNKSIENQKDEQLTAFLGIRHDKKAFIASMLMLGRKSSGTRTL